MAFLTRGRAVVQRRRPAVIATLDELPFPAWDLVDVERYRAHLAPTPRLLLDEPGDDARLPVPLQLVREADLGPALRRAQRRRTSSTRSRWLKRTFAPDHLWFVDDIFGLKPGWIERVRRPGRERRRARFRSAA